jgi:hypothetical protein
MKNKKKIIGIGDTHTRDIWKKVVEYHKDADKFVFFGDYEDPYYDPSEDEILSGVVDIIQFKKDNPDKVVLLIGNHDAHYIWRGEIEPCSRYDRFLAPTLQKLFNNNLDLFTFAYKVDNHLFTHAGVANSWLSPRLETLKLHGLNDDYSNIDVVLNKLNKTKEGRKIIHVVGYLRGGWNPSDVGGPTWADIEETRDDYITGIHQYVGHSKVHYINKITILNNGGSITYCDTLHKNGASLKYDVLQLEI